MHEVHALLRQPPGDGLADALAGAGDERGATFQSEIHVFTSAEATDATNSIRVAAASAYQAEDPPRL